MKFVDATATKDTIEAVIKEVRGNKLISVIMLGDYLEIYLTKQSAKAFGEYLIKLSEKI